MNEKEIRLLQRIASLWRNDWSGDSFDGRDGKKWINMVIDGKYDDLDVELRKYE